MIEGFTHHRSVLPPHVLSEVWDYLLTLDYTRIERGAMHLWRALQNDNMLNEQAHRLTSFLKSHGLERYISFDDVSVVRYDAGSDYVDWHSDGGPLLETGCAMGILSLGVSRPMEFRRKDNEADSVRLMLDAGDLIVSREGFQTEYQHRIPPCDQEGVRHSIVLFTHRKSQLRNNGKKDQIY